MQNYPMSNAHEYNATFYQLLMASHPPGVAALLRRWAGLNQLQALDGLFDYFEAQCVRGDLNEINALDQWFHTNEYGALAPNDQYKQVTRHQSQGEYLPGGPPVQTLSFAFWPAQNKAASNDCAEVPFDASQMHLFVRAIDILKKIELACQLLPGSTKRGSFQKFAEHCLAGVRDQKAIELLIASGLDLKAKTNLAAIKRGHDATLDKRIVTNVMHIATMELNAPALEVFRVLRKNDVKALDLLIAPLICDDAKGAMDDHRSYLVDAMGHEVTQGLDGAQGSLTQTLARLCRDVSELSRCTMLVNWLDAALRMQKNTPAARATVDLLLSWMPTNFNAAVARCLADKPNAFSVTSLIKAATAQSSTPVLKIFRYQVCAMIQSPESQFDQRSWDFRSAAVNGAVSGFGRRWVNSADFRRAAEFLRECGCDFSKGRGERGSILHDAAHYARDENDLMIMLTLVEFGCNPHSKNLRGWTPASHLVANLKKPWDQLLRSHNARHAAIDAIDEIVRELSSPPCK